MKAKTLIPIFLAIAVLLSTVLLTVGVLADSAKLGDVNDDGSINAKDYMMLKRHVLGTYTLSKAQQLVADINGDGSINAKDYMMLKRHVLGTYTIGSETENPNIAKVKAAIASQGAISTQYNGSIAGFAGTADISFVTVNTVLVLRGHAVTDNGMVIDIELPFSAISENYQFTGNATLEQLSGKASGTLNAAAYTVDDITIANLKFTDTGSVNLTPTLTKRVNELCKEAMDQFLYQANKLLESPSIGLTIADFGFTQFYQEIQDGLMDL